MLREDLVGASAFLAQPYESEAALCDTFAA